MINLTPITDPKEILSFVKGKGMRRNCAAGADVSEQYVLDCIRKDNVYLKAEEDGKNLGMVVFSNEKGAWFIHLCLRTIGFKTREVFGLALAVAKLAGLNEVHASFIKTRKACFKLLQEFEFQMVSENETFYNMSLKL